MYHKSTKCISTAFVGKNGTAGVAMRVPEGYPGHSAASAPGDAAPLLGVGESAPAHARLPYRIWCTLAFKLYFSRLIFPSETQH